MKRKLSAILLILVLTLTNSLVNAQQATVIIDPSFNIGTGFNNGVKVMVLQPDGKIIVGGIFTLCNGVTTKGLIRLNSDGTKDTSFNIGTGFDGFTYCGIYSITLQSNGKILVGGDFGSYNGVNESNLIRLNADGTKDSSFNIGTGFSDDGGTYISIVKTIVLQPDGKILVGGNFSFLNGSPKNKFVRLNPDGSMDYSDNFYLNAGQVNNFVNSIILKSDGKILVGGNFTTFNNPSIINRLIRLNSNGSKDNSLNIGSGFSNYINYITTRWKCFGVW